MGKHSEDVCAECGKREKNMTFVSWFIKKDGTKGATLCKKHELKAQNDYLRGK